MLERAGSILLNPKVFYIAIYVAIWSLHSLLIKLSLKRNVEAGGEGYPYDIWLMALNTELVKLALSTLYLCFRPEAKNGPVQALKDLWGVSQYAKYFAVPAVIYCIANVLMFINLRLVAVPTYRILINSRIIFSGLLLQQFFSKRLTLMQWVALGILIFGCTLEQLGSFNIAEGGILALVFIGIQGLCSSLGGVYFQWLLQRNTGAQDIGLVEKNIFLYGWMSFMNVVYILVMQPNVLSGAAFWRNFSPTVLPIVVAGSFGGFTTSLLLRHLDVIAKEYANSLEMVSVYLLSHELLGTTLSGYMAGSIILVGISLLIYTREDANKAAAPTPAPALPLKSLGFDEKDKKMEEGESEPDSAPVSSPSTAAALTSSSTPATTSAAATAASPTSGDIVQRVRTEAVAAR